MDPRRLENEDEEKFWEAWIKDELTFCYRFGKIGSPGGTKLKKFKTAAEAQAALEEKLQQKLAEGFVELGAEEEDEDEEEEDEKEEDDTDEEEEDEEDGDEDDDTDDDEEEDGEEKRSEPPPPPPPPPKPTLPQRIRSLPAPATAHDLESATEKLALVAKAIGGRSWRVSQRGRAAARALARLGGLDPQSNKVLAPMFSGLMAEVIAPKKRLSLSIALSLLWEVDADVAQKIVVGWRAKMLSSPASTSIGVLAATFDTVPDLEVALHTGAALVDRHLPPDAWKLRFAKVVPFLEVALATKGSDVAGFLKGLKPDGDPIVKARVKAAASVKGDPKIKGALQK